MIESSVHLHCTFFCSHISDLPALSDLWPGSRNRGETYRVWRWGRCQPPGSTLCLWHWGGFPATTALSPAWTCTCVGRVIKVDFNEPLVKIGNRAVCRQTRVCHGDREFAKRPAGIQHVWSCRPRQTGCKTRTRDCGAQTTVSSVYQTHTGRNLGNKETNPPLKRKTES